MKRSSKKLLTRLLPVIAVFLAINIGFGIEYFLRIPSEWYTSTEAGEYDASSVRDFAVDSTEKIVYMTSGNDLLIIDVDDIDAPALLSSFDKTNLAKEVTIEGDKLVLTGLKDFNVIDISTPSLPQNKSVFTIHENYTINDVEIVDEIVYLAVSADTPYIEAPLGKRVLYIVNISDSVNPVELKMIRRFDFFAHDLFIDDDILYLSMSDWGVQLFDISNASNPVIYNPGSYSAFGLVSQLRQYVDIQKTAVKTIGGTKYIFVADNENGYVIGDMSNPSEPEAIDGIIIEDVVSLSVSNQYAYILLRDRGQIQVYSLEKPSRFNIVGKFDPLVEGGDGYDITVHEATSVLYMLRNGGLSIFRLVEGVKNDYYREEASLSYTWIAIILSLIICVPLAVSAIIRNKETYSYSSKY